MTIKDYRPMSGADVIEQRIKTATEDMPKACYSKLLRLGPNGLLIADYLIKYKLEATKGVKDSTRATVCNNLELFARRVNKPFIDITRDDVLGYLDGLKKPEDYTKYDGQACAHILNMTIKDYRPMSGADVIEQRIKTATEDMPKACYSKLLRLGPRRIKILVRGGKVSPLYTQFT